MMRDRGKLKNIYIPGMATEVLLLGSLKKVSYIHNDPLPGLGLLLKPCCVKAKILIENRIDWANKVFITAIVSADCSQIWFWKDCWKCCSPRHHLALAQGWLETAVPSRHRPGSVWASAPGAVLHPWGKWHRMRLTPASGQRWAVTGAREQCLAHRRKLNIEWQRTGRAEEGGGLDPIYS